MSVRTHAYTFNAISVFPSRITSHRGIFCSESKTKEIRLFIFDSFPRKRGYTSRNQSYNISRKQLSKEKRKKMH